MKFPKIVVVAISLLTFSALTAQIVNSPCSRNGLGERLYQGLPNNFSMGEIGIGSPNTRHINIQNPFHPIYNRLNSFQVGLNGDFRSFESDNGFGSGSAASLRFLAISFPIVTNRWATSFTLLPLTTVSSNSFSSEIIEDNITSETQFEGEGGLSQVSWSNGFWIYKNLMLGVKASYLFGQIQRQVTIDINEENTSSFAGLTLSQLAYFEELSYSDVNVSFRLSYKVFLSDSRDINFGMTYALSNTLNGSRDTYYGLPAVRSAQLGLKELSEDEVTEYSLPQSFGFGISYEVANKLLVGVDVETQDWKSAANSERNSSLRNTTTLDFGASITPDVQSVSSSLKRTTYRLGVNLREVSYLANRTEVNDFGINFGSSQPVNVYSSLDLGLKFGQRSTTDNNLSKKDILRS